MDIIKIQLKARSSIYHETGKTPEPSVMAPQKDLTLTALFLVKKRQMLVRACKE